MSVNQWASVSNTSRAGGDRAKSIWRRMICGVAAVAMLGMAFTGGVAATAEATSGAVSAVAPGGVAPVAKKKSVTMRVSSLSPTVSSSRYVKTKLRCTTKQKCTVKASLKILGINGSKKVVKVAGKKSKTVKLRLTDKQFTALQNTKKGTAKMTLTLASAGRKSVTKSRTAKTSLLPTVKITSVGTKVGSDRKVTVRLKSMISATSKGKIVLVLNGKKSAAKSFSLGSRKSSNVTVSLTKAQYAALEKSGTGKVKAQVSTTTKYKRTVSKTVTAKSTAPKPVDLGRPRC